MSGPYYKGQRAALCGCYFPDVTRLFDDKVSGTRVLYCERHGRYRVPCDREAMLTSRQDIPTPEWRKEARAFLRSGKGAARFIAVPRSKYGY